MKPVKSRLGYVTIIQRINHRDYTWFERRELLIVSRIWYAITTHVHHPQGRWPVLT